MTILISLVKIDITEEAKNYFKEIKGSVYSYFLVL